MDQWDIQSLVDNKVDCGTTWDQHIDNYIASIGGNDAVESEYVIMQSDIDELFLQISTPKKSHNQNLALIVLIRIDTINGVLLSQPLVALCDSGSINTIMNKRSLPNGVEPL